MEKVYIAIDLKSFYASVECVERGLDPMNTNLVVADKSRTEKTICLAVSPTLKSYGISGRARLFEVIQRVNEINEQRKRNAPKHTLNDKSYINSELCADVALEVRVNDDPNAANAAAKGKQVYGVHLTLEGSKIQGDLRNTDDRTANVYLRDSRIRGAMHGITLWMQEGGFWFASGDSDVVLVGEFSLSQIDAPLGVTVHAFGAENVSYGLPSGGQLVISAR